MWRKSGQVEKKNLFIFIIERKAKIKVEKENYPPFFSTMWIEYPQRLGKNFNAFY